MSNQSAIKKFHFCTTKLKTTTDKFIWAVGLFNNSFLAIINSRQMAAFSTNNSNKNELPEEKQNNSREKASNFQYFKAYCWAMVGDYEQLYGLHLKDEHDGKMVTGKWANANPKIVDEVLLRLYNFEKRLLVGALALLYFSIIGFLLAAIVYFKNKNAKLDKNGRNETFEGRIKQWEKEFGRGGMKNIDEFFRKCSIEAKNVRKVSFYTNNSSINNNGLLIFEIEENSGGPQEKNLDEEKRNK